MCRAPVRVLTPQPAAATILLMIPLPTKRSTPSTPAAGYAYEGHPAHKRYPSEWGAAGLRSDKSECPEEIPAAEVARVMPEALQQAVELGQLYVKDDGAWPHLVWGRSVFHDRGGHEVVIVWEARVTNPQKPSYHAYPISPSRHDSHLPRQVAEILWPQD